MKNWNNEAMGMDDEIVIGRAGWLLLSAARYRRFKLTSDVDFGGTVFVRERLFQE